MPNQKPPIGIEPRIVVEARRTVEILQAMTRYIQADIPIPDEWRDELDELLDANEQRHLRKQELPR